MGGVRSRESSKKQNFSALMSRPSRTSERRPGDRRKLPRILIVTEDDVTEPNYLDDLRQDENLPSVVVEPAPRSEPWSVVGYGLRKFLPSDGEESEYERLYCVFDRDEHDRFGDAIERLKRISNNGRSVYWIYSIPCFEYWILLHFRQMGPLKYYTGSRSPCSGVVQDIESESHIDDYQRVKPNIYKETKTNMDRAISNARTMWGQNGGRRFDDPHPRTRMHKLVAYLRQIR